MIDKDAFLKPLLPERDVELPGVGTVRVRALSRAEAVSLGQFKSDVPKLECRIILLGLVDPILTADEVDDWYANSPANHADLIITAVDALSGLSEGAPKSGVPGVREGQ